ncbi:MAG: hypothetical protein IPM29_18550 [Planctomycetes bacterium]|nr:hypothetical protein [Planctomycetota bacterium]
MRTRSEFLIWKRDGRAEALRATKLARSLEAALRAAGEGEAWTALELAEAILRSLRCARIRRAADAPLTSAAELAELAVAGLWAAGFTGAARAFAAAGVRQRARTALLAERSVGADTLGGVAGAAHRRDPAARYDAEPERSSSRSGPPRGAAGADRFGPDPDPVPRPEWN